MGEPTYAVSWRWREYPSLVAMAVAGVLMVVVPPVLGAPALVPLILLPFVAVLTWLLLRFTVVGAELRTDTLVLRTPVRTVTLPLAELEVFAPGAERAFYGTLHRRGSMVFWRLPYGVKLDRLLDLVEAAAETRGSSRGTTSSARAAGS